MLSPAEAAEAARQHIWGHLVHRDTQMFYDYAWAQQGFTYLPTPEEIARSFPNRAGWGTGMENPALNAGQYLAAVVLRHRLVHDAASADEARLLFAGLRRLFAVARDPGFLPRGVALNAVSHYPNSSIDQYTMVFYGLLQYYRSDLPSNEEREAVRQIWHSVLARWERDGWEDRTEDGQPAWYGEIGAVTPDRGSRLLAALLGGAVVTGDHHWRQLYRRKLEEQDHARLKTGLPRPIAALYVFDQNQVAWRLLADLEEEPRVRAEYEARLAETAAAVRERLLTYGQFDPAAHAGALPATDWDWRRACVPPGEPQTTLEQVRQYNQRLHALQPVWTHEHYLVQEPFEAAHVLLLSGDRGSLAFLRPHLKPLFAAYPYDQFALSWSVYETEWVYWLAVQAGLL